MHIADSTAATRRRAPLPDGPTAAVLTPDGVSDRVAVLHVELPAGGRLPEHDHGASEIVLIPLTGSLELHHVGRVRVLSAGAAAHVAAGERVSLANPGTEPATVMIVASPPEFAARLAAWPVA